MKKILIDLLLLFLAATVIWWLIEGSGSCDKIQMRDAAPADTVYIQGIADTTIAEKKYRHRVAKKREEQSPPDTLFTQSYTAVVSLEEAADSVAVNFEILVREREIFRVDTVRVTEYECDAEWYAAAAGVVVMVVLIAVLR
ncbi:MAG: hypothetical protein L6Q47_11150 [Ignavibacteriaceae bacterium]|nr:hypothetical protein [Ignavibacteriaceae bacterium]